VTWLDQQLSGLDVDDDQSLRGVQQEVRHMSADASAIAARQPERSAGDPPHRGIEVSQPQSISFQQALIAHPAAGRGCPQPPRVVPLVRIGRERPHLTPTDDDPPVNPVQRRRDRLTVLIDEADLKIPRLVFDHPFESDPTTRRLDDDTQTTRKLDNDKFDRNLQGARAAIAGTSRPGPASPGRHRGVTPGITGASPGRHRGGVRP
jgi:hypothetical protein